MQMQLPPPMASADRAVDVPHLATPMPSAARTRSRPSVRPLLFALLSLFVLCSPVFVRGFSWAISQWSGACITIAIAQYWPTPGHREFFMSCQYVGVVNIIFEVQSSLLIPKNVCYLDANTQSALQVSGDTLFVACGNGVLAFDLIARTTSTVLNSVESSYGAFDLAFDPVTQRLFTVTRDGLLSVGLTNGLRNSDPIIRYVNETQCPGPRHIAMFEREVYTVCGGGGWSVWSTNIDTGATVGVISSAVCTGATNLYANVRGLFVLCMRLPDYRVLLHRYSLTGVLEWTYPDTPAQTLKSVWASATDDFVLAGTKGGGLLSYANGSTPDSQLSRTGCSDLVDLKVVQRAGLNFDLLVACTNAPLVWTVPFTGAVRLLSDSCGGSAQVVVNPISGNTYVGCGDQILVYSSTGVGLTLFECLSVVAMNSDLHSDSVYAVCGQGINRMVKMSPTTGDATFNNFCNEPRAIAGGQAAFMLLCADFPVDILFIDVAAQIRSALPFNTFCPPQRPVAMTFARDGTVWIVCNGQVYSYDRTTSFSALRANYTQCSEPNAIDASSLDGSVVVACRGGGNPLQAGGVLRISGSTVEMLTTNAECNSANSVAYSTMTGEITAICGTGTSGDYILLVLSPYYGHYTAISDYSLIGGSIAYNAFNGNSVFTTISAVFEAGCVFAVEITDQLGNVLSKPPILTQTFHEEIYYYYPAIPDALNSPTGMYVTVHFATQCTANANINGASITALSSGQQSLLIPVPVTNAGVATLQISATDATYNYYFALGSINRFSVQTAAGTVLLPTTAQPFQRTQHSYSMIAPINEPFPATLSLTVDLAYGTAVASMDQTASVTVLDDTPLNLALSSLPTPDAVHPLLLNASIGGLYFLTLSNACGFSIGAVGGAGSACAAVPQSSCIPTDIHSFVCSPSFLPATLDVASVSTFDPRSPPGNRSVLLTTAETSGLVLSLGMAPGSSLIVAVGPALAPFSSLLVTFASIFANAAPRPCLLPGFPSASAAPDGSFSFTCQLPNQIVGAGFRFSIQVCAGAAPAQCSQPFTSTDTLSSPAPSFVPMTLTRRAPVRGLLSASGELVAAGMAETLNFQVLNIASSASITSVFYASMDRLQEVIAQFRLGGDNAAQADWITAASVSAIRAQNRSLPECRVNSALSQPNFLVCDTPDLDPNNPLTGQSLHFLMIVGGQWTISTDTYSYPVQPQVTRVSGCSDSGNSTGDCPTLGNVTLTIFGSGFSTVEKNAFAQIGGVDCPVGSVNLGGSRLTCTLPKGAGNQVPVVVQSYSLFSPLAPLLSYAAPRILNASCSACAGWSDAGSGVQLTDCQRNTTGSTLTLSGVHFGPGGATIFIGSVLCPSDGVVHANPHTSASCILPPGKGLGQPILLSQANGKLSTSVASVSYSVCPAGTVDASVSSAVLDCIPCAPGEFSDTAGAQFCNACPGGLYLAAPPIDALTGQQRYPRSSDCTQCADGAQCTGQMVASADDHYLFTDAATKQLRVALCPAGYCRQCTGDDVAAASLNGATMLTCCGAHRDPASPLCGACLPGYEDWNGDCRPCTKSDGGIVFVFLLLSTVLVAWLAHSASNASVGLTAIVLYFLQTLTLQLQETAVLLSWLQAINFDPSVLHSAGNACPMKLSAYGQTVFAILVPLLLLAELLLVAAVHALAYARIDHAARGSLSGGSVASAGAGAAAGLAQLRRGSTFRYLTSRSRHHVVHWASNFSVLYYKNAAIAVLQFSYTSVSLAVIEFLWCVNVGDRSVVFSSPSMVCGSAEYNAVQPLALTALVLFVIAFPLLVLAGGWWRSRRLAKDRGGAAATASVAAGSVSPRQSDATAPVSHSLSVLIPLYGVFRPEAWYWSSLVLMRRTLFAFLSVALAAVPRSRSAAFAFSNLVFCFLSLYAAPFRTRTLNLLECVSQLALNIVALLTTVQLPPYGAPINILLLVVFLAMLLLFAFGVWMAQQSKRSVLDAALAKQIEAEQQLDHDRSAAGPNGRNGSVVVATEMITLNPLHAGASEESKDPIASPSHAHADDRPSEDEPIGGDSAAL